MFPIAGIGAIAAPGATGIPGLNTSATGQTGHQSQGGDFMGGAINFGSGANNLMLYGGIAILAYLLWKRK
ncbi:MAG: hypothetical protein ACK4GU_13465 [Alishewanella aestuarii]